MLTIAIDFDGTLAIGNKSHITLAEPNYSLIKKLKELKKNIDVKIKIVTARGSKNNLSEPEKISRYMHLIEDFCKKYDVPYDSISFNKEYADLYIDDMTINQNANFFSLKSSFTNNSLIFTDKSVIKKSKSSIFEKEWYEIAKFYFNVPEILFCNDETIITKRIYPSREASVDECIDILKAFKEIQIKNFPYTTYIDNLKITEYASKNTLKVIEYINNNTLFPTFFHGDFSIDNILFTNKMYLIDPNYKYVFGNYITDAGKLYFSMIAYKQNLKDAEKIAENFGEDTIRYAVAEGLRVCKYNCKYISIVNNIASSCKI
jgi:hypothetical protein